MIHVRILRSDVLLSKYADLAATPPDWIFHNQFVYRGINHTAYATEHRSTPEHPLKGLEWVDLYTLPNATVTNLFMPAETAKVYTTIKIYTATSLSQIVDFAYNNGIPAPYIFSAPHEVSLCPPWQNPLELVWIAISMRDPETNICKDEWMNAVATPEVTLNLYLTV